MEKKELIEKLNNLFAVEDVVSKDELLAEKVLEVLEQELDKAREEGFREGKKELLKELIVVMEHGTPEEFQKELDNLTNK